MIDDSNNNSYDSLSIVDRRRPVVMSEMSDLWPLDITALSASGLQRLHIRCLLTERRRRAIEYMPVNTGRVDGRPFLLAELTGRQLG